MKTLEMHSHELPRRIYGIDFSGANDACRKIWVAGGRIEGNVLHIEECSRASELPGAGNEQERCLKALRGFIANETDSAFGLDFPFGLPLAMVEEKSWEDLLSGSQQEPLSHHIICGYIARPITEFVQS